MLSTKLEAPPIKAISHIQNTAPGPPAATAIATPAILPVPTLEAVLIQKAWKDDTPFLSFLPLGFKRTNISFKYLN